MSHNYSRELMKFLIECFLTFSTVQMMSLICLSFYKLSASGFPAAAFTAIYTVVLISSVLLLHGVRTRDHFYMAPYLVFQVLEIIMVVIELIQVTKLGHLIAGLAVLTLYVYCCICMFSLYDQFRREKFMRNEQVTFHVQSHEVPLAQVATFVHPKDQEANVYQPAAGRQQCEMPHSPPPQYAHVVNFNEMLGCGSSQTN